jgi:hypothetical protein
MFRRLSDSLPKDPKIPRDLTALGYFLNEDGEIRQIEHPDQKYQYQVNRNERVNEIHKEAMNGKSSDHTQSTDQSNQTPTQLASAPSSSIVCKSSISIPSASPSAHLQPRSTRKF